MGRLLASRRRRRRLIRTTIVLAVAAGVGVVVGTMRNTAETFETPLRNEPVKRVVERQPVVLSEKELEGVHDVAVRFIETAVRREHVERSWALASPLLRRGYTIETWKKGDIPVVPYPAESPRHAPWKVLYSYEDDVLLQVALLPLRGSGVTRGQVFEIELSRKLTGASRDWLVASWMPRSYGSVGNVQARAAASIGPAPPPPKAPLTAHWLLVPLAFFGAALVVLAGLGARNWLVGRRAVRTYLESAER